MLFSAIVRAAILCHAVVYIVLLRPKPKMIWIDAARIITTVEDAKIVWNRAVMK